MRPRNIDELFYFCQPDLTNGCLTAFIWPLFWSGKHYYLCFFCTPLIDWSPSNRFWGKLRQMRRQCWPSISRRVGINSAVPQRAGGRYGLVLAADIVRLQSAEAKVFTTNKWNVPESCRLHIQPQWTLRCFVECCSSRWHVDEVELKGWLWDPHWLVWSLSGLFKMGLQYFAPKLSGSLTRLLWTQPELWEKNKKKQQNASS